MITTGFTFALQHSSKFGIVCDPTTRILLPEKRRNMVDIPGRSGAHMHTDGTYRVRQEIFHCYYIPQNGKSLSDATRDIAAWLAKDGVLVFDNEPDKYYTAYFTGAIPSVRHLKYGEFDLTFTYSPPFAYTETKQVVKSITSAEDFVMAIVNGTADTPCRIIIKNEGATTISNIRIKRSLQ